MARPGEGDVRQPCLLGALVGLPLRLERVEVRLGHPPEHRQVGGVAAQLERQGRRRGHPGRPGQRGRELLLRDPDGEDDVPLQPLGAVHREQLDAVGLRGRRLVEAGAVLALGLQVAQQGRQRDVAVDGLELRDRLDEQVEVVAPGRRRGTDRGRQLDVEPRGVDDAAHEVEQRLARRAGAAAAAPLDSSPKRSRASDGVRRGAGVVERVRQGRDLGRVGAGDRVRELLVDRSVALPVAGSADLGQVPGATPQQREVARTDGPPGTGQQREQRGVVRQVVQQGEGGDHLADLGQPEQPVEADDLDRHLGVGQRTEDAGGVLVVAHQHRDVLPRPVTPARVGALTRGTDRAGQPGQLVLVVLEGLGVQVAGRRIGRRLERQHPQVDGRDRLGHGRDHAVGELEDA